MKIIRVSEVLRKLFKNQAPILARECGYNPEPAQPTPEKDCAPSIQVPLPNTPWIMKWGENQVAVFEMYVSGILESLGFMHEEDTVIHPDNPKRIGWVYLDTRDIRLVLHDFHHKRYLQGQERINLWALTQRIKNNRTAIHSQTGKPSFS